MRTEIVLTDPEYLATIGLSFYKELTLEGRAWMDEGNQSKKN